MRRLRLLLLVILIEACVAGTSCVTKSKCRKLGTKTNVEAGCQPKSQDCEGKRVTGKKYCKDYKSCDCCVPPIECSEGRLRPCEVLNGTCMSQNEVCDGREVSDKTFCKSSDTCKCCFRETPCPCSNTSCEAVYQNQTYEGICRSGDCLHRETRADICPNSDCNCCINVTGCSEEDGFFMINGSSQCFKLFDHHHLLDWYQGKSKCLSEGLRLAEPMDVVAITLRKYIMDLFGKYYMWLGAKYDDESQFRWESNNVPISNSNPLWYPGHSTRSNHCLLILSDTYYWNKQPSKPYSSNPCTYSYSRHVLCELVRD